MKLGLVDILVGFLFLCSFLFCFVVGKMEIIIDEKIDNCTKPYEIAEVWDFSNFELIAESDTEVYANGSVKFLKDVDGRWAANIFAEKFYRGQWNIYAFDKKVPDFCASKHNPAELWYKYFKDTKPCPLKAGVIFFY